MDNAAYRVQQETDKLYRGHYSSILATLLYLFADIGLETAEDIVQDAFAAALTAWVDKGIPANPAGWIFTVCKNKAITRLKTTKKTRLLVEDEDFGMPETIPSPSFFKDRQLKLLFACAHPHLAPKVQVVITLKYVASLKVEAIAKILGMTIDGVDKMLLRARQKLRNEKILLEEPGEAGLKPRLPIVHKIIYLIFNEGYKSSWGNGLLREELCEDALTMNQVLYESNLGNSDTAALQALMLFNAARFKARFGPAGELLDLEEQNRALWNKQLIALACRYLKQPPIPASTYHFEASIAFLHSTAPSFAATNWPLIATLYAQLLQIAPNPFVELNYAIALYYAGQTAKAFSILGALRQHAFLSQYYLLNATLGKLHLLQGNHAEAKLYFTKTLAQTNLPAERDFIMKMMRKIPG